jgi:plasmid stabilization system protein ParE
MGPGITGALSELVFTQSARRNIRSIWRYIAADSVRHADNVKLAILATCTALIENPQLGHRRADMSDRDILFVPVNGYKNYLIAYRVTPESLTILAVLHGARNVPRLFPANR